MKHAIQDCAVVGIDLAKNSFAIHGADALGHPLFKATCSRSKLLSTLAKAPACQVCMEACGGAHHLGRELQRMGHRVGLIPPTYVKPFVKCQKNDANDDDAIVEAASRPTMRVMSVKSAATQALASMFRARQLAVRQRTQTANSIRGMLTEFGITAAIGLTHVDQLRERMDEQGAMLPSTVKDAMQTLFALLAQLDEHVETLSQAIKARAKASDDAQRLMRVPGVGPITALAIQAFAGDLKGFRNGREFAAWLGLTPKEHSTVRDNLSCPVCVKKKCPTYGTFPRTSEAWIGGSWNDVVDDFVSLGSRRSHGGERTCTIGGHTWT